MPVINVGDTVTFPISKTLSGVGSIVAIDGEVAIIHRSGKTYNRLLKDLTKYYKQEQ